MTQKFLYSTNLRHLLKSHSELQLYFLYSNFFFFHLYKHLYFLTNPFEFLTSCSFPSPWLYVCAYSWLHVNYIRSKGNTFSSVQFSCSVMSDSLWPHEPQHARLPCPSPTPRAYPNLCLLSRWCHPATSSSVVPFSSCHQSLPASGIFPMSHQFTSDDQNTEALASALVLPVNIQGWFPLVLTGVISLLSKGLSGVFFNTTVQRHQFFGILLSLWFRFHNSIWPLGRP